MHQVLFALCVILSCNVSFGKSDTAKELEKINENLVKTVPYSEELNKNINALKQLFNGESKVNVFNMEYRKTLEKLNYLVENKCDKTTVDYFELIDASLHFESREKEPIKRISKVVKQLLSKHAKNCQKVYPELFHSKTADLDHEKNRYVDTLLDSLYNVDGKFDWRTQRPRDLFEYYIKGAIIWSHHMKGVLKALQTDLSDDSASEYIKAIEDEVAGKKAVNEEKLRGIYNLYLLEPCRHYVSVLGPEVFVPAQYDGSLYHEVDEEEGDYYKSWFKYRICKQLLVDESFVFEHLVNYI